MARMVKPSRGNPYNHSRLVAFARGVAEYEDENASVGVKLASSRSLGRGKWIGRRNMIPLNYKPRS